MKALLRAFFLAKNQSRRMEKLDLLKYTQWLEEISQQPPWRSKADKEMDYYAGNQLDAEVLERQRAVGIPPAIEPLIGPTIDAVLGMEVKNRLDWRVLAEEGGDEIALALNHELNQAEKKSKADAACSEAYATQVSVGLGWVEVGRNADPFKYPYRCRAIHRNEIWWDWLAKEPDLSDARYLIRRKWMDREQAALMFESQRELIMNAAMGWNGVDIGSFINDGGTATGMGMSLEEERGWSIEEMEWRDLQTKRVCLFEVWYQVWEKALIIKMDDGRVVEFDKKNLLHMSMVAESGVKPRYAVVSRMRLSWWVGPHKLHDGPTPYKHNKFPYVPFWGKREDRTGKPFGLIRGMMYLQDEVNARISKMQWGLAATKVIRTQGAVLMSDAEFNAEVGRPDADIVLDAGKMREGGVFRIEKDFQLNAQQFSRLEDAREGIKRAGGIYNAFMGQGGQAKSGVAINSLVDQSSQTLADINDNFRVGRAGVGELLLSLIIEDIGDRAKEVKVPPGISKEEQIITLNAPGEDGEGLDNDIQQIHARVELSDVPSSPTFRSQQLQTLGGAFESMPANFQAIALPHLLNLMDIPNKDEIMEAVKQASAQPTQEDIQKMIDDAVKQSKVETMAAQKDRDLDIKERSAQAKDDLILKQAIEAGVRAAYSAMQTGAIIMQNPAVAPVGDDVLAMAAGGEVGPVGPAVAPQEPGQMMPATQDGMAPGQEIMSPAIGQEQGMETPGFGDNLGGMEG
jgi:hypothetical protein